MTKGFLSLRKKTKSTARKKFAVYLRSQDATNRCNKNRAIRQSSNQIKTNSNSNQIKSINRIEIDASLSADDGRIVAWPQQRIRSNFDRNWRQTTLIVERLRFCCVLCTQQTSQLTTTTTTTITPTRFAIPDYPLFSGMSSLTKHRKLQTNRNEIDPNTTPCK